MFIFVDFNGTIANFTEAVKKYKTGTLKEFWKGIGFNVNESDLRKAQKNADEWELQQIKNKNPVMFGDYTMKVAEHLGINITRENALLEEAIFIRFVSHNISLVKDADNGLIQLSKLAPLFVLSQGYSNTIIMSLAKLGVLRYFSAIVPLREMSMRKDEPAYEVLVEKFGKGHIIIGDNEKTDGLAKKFGWHFIDVRKGWDTTVKEVEDILKSK